MDLGFVSEAGPLAGDGIRLLQISESFQALQLHRVRGS